MSYEHRSRVNNRIVPSPIKFLSIIIGILILLSIIFPNFLSGFFTTIVSPFWNIEKSLRGDSMDQQRALQGAVVSELEKQNAEFKEMLHRNASTSPMLLAYVIKKPPFSAYDSYVIDIGDNKVEIGDKVYALGNILIGEIAEVNSNYAKVKLYSSYGEKYDVQIGSSNIQATATGQGGGSFEVTLPKESKVHVNDNVIIPDLEPSIFGIVKSVNIESARAFSTILFSQPINIYEVKWVEIYKKNSK